MLLPSSLAGRQRRLPAPRGHTAGNKGPTAGPSPPLAPQSPPRLAGGAGAELERQGQWVHWLWVFQPPSPYSRAGLQGAWGRDNAQGPVLVPPSPNWPLPTGADTILPGCSGRRIPHHPSPSLPLGILGRAPAAKSHFHRSTARPAHSNWPVVPQVFGTGRVPQPLTSSCTVGTAPQSPPTVGWVDGRSPPEPGIPWPKAAQLCRSRWHCWSPNEASSGGQNKVALQAGEGKAVAPFLLPCGPMGTLPTWPHRD